MICELTVLSLIRWDVVDDELLTGLSEGVISEAKYLQFRDIRRLVTRAMDTGYTSFTDKELQLLHKANKYLIKNNV